MLDAETRRRIDTARDILVGKLPDPKSQVEQITIALIYKFMEDMDREAVEMGGKRTFFTGDFEKYSWSNIFNPRLGGHEMLNLYAEAIARMSQNPNLPELFRNIFKNAYLPYRDPEILKLFLKTINEFTYDHSERLGDAFEYLLSVLGSQGDAGQFRTPRHIIDFMVEIISPKKNELILDPACGTAGFLISSYKYIMRENTSEKFRSRNGNGIGNLLTTEEKKKLLTNFKGYDISPDLVRISLVNMYLHGFVNPQIYEYDTLTNEERWNEYADVILANPPFMTPKGGIKPHKRFSVQSNRSEVLFVDYIAEHLTPTGRAAVIVPEGIVFQSARAYKQLRKMLVENFLIAVVSLPAGVFNPYSGVKTSILIMDKELAKKTDSILFVKIENDGFDLGAQRRPIDKNDLPDALQVIREYIDKVRNGKVDEFNAEEKPCSALLVKKEKLAENGEYNLTGDRYRVVERRKHQKWPMVRLGEVLELSGKDRVGEEELPIMSITMYRGLIDQDEKFKKRIASKNIENYKKVYKDELVVGFPIDEGVLGFQTKYKVAAVSPAYDIWKLKEQANIFIPYLEIIFRSKQAREIYKSRMRGTVSRRRDIPASDFLEIQIPLPPLEVQQEIVAEIEGYQKIIDGCKQVIDAWKPDVETYLEEELKAYLAQHPEKQEELANGWPMVKLGEVCEKISDTIEPNNLKGEVKYIGLEHIESNTGNLIGSIVAQYENIKSTKNVFQEKDILYGKLRPNLNKVHLTKFSGICSTDIYVFRTKKNIKPEYLDCFLRSKNFNKQVLQGLGGAQLPRVNFNYMVNLQIPLPPLEVQSRIVDKIESERKVIDSLKEMIKIYKEKIKKVIDRVWGGIKYNKLYKEVNI
ncbi:MAG: N-6 DNA methylase [Ignavibacteria bacterium]|nr:N-6 DNA methylase [Ignavibacteria bacterium]